MAVLCALIGVLVTVFHAASGSSSSELGSHPDEAAHFVTGLMVRDYLVSGFHQSPLAYADLYYKHYPKIGLGNWPPFFYIVQALWTLAFSAGVGSVLRLMELLAIAVSLLTAWWLWREFSWLEAAAGAVLLTALPLVQQYSNMVMAEILSTLLMFAAAGFFALYLEEATWGRATAFGICAGLAIMTKGTGLALALMPLFAILFTGRFDILKRLSLWVAGLLVAVIAGPWTWHFRNIGRGGWEEASPSVHFTQLASVFYGQQMAVALGGLLALLTLAGAISLFVVKFQKRPIAICSLALVLGVWIFQSVTPVGLEARHLTPAMPALVLLAISGLHAITSRIPRARPVLSATLVALFFALPAIFHPAAPSPGYGSLGNRIALSPFRIPRKQWSGFLPIADAVLASGPGKPILVASDSRGEGMLIADVAALDPHRPSYTIERASKLLASSTWSGSAYQSFYQTPDQVRDAAAKAGIGLIVTDSSPNPLPPHDELLIEAMTASKPLLRYESVRDGKISEGAIEAYDSPIAH
jgi:hypothetical protein